MRPDMIQSVIRAPYSPVVCPSELVYMLLGCLDDGWVDPVISFHRWIRRTSCSSVFITAWSWPSIEDWRTRVLAAEARKAGSASEAARRIPSPPSFTGKEAWDHWVSVRLIFKTVERPLLCVSAYYYYYHFYYYNYGLLFLLLLWIKEVNIYLETHVLSSSLPQTNLTIPITCRCSDVQWLCCSGVDSYSVDRRSKFGEDWKLMMSSKHDYCRKAEDGRCRFPHRCLNKTKTSSSAFVK